MQAAVYPLHNTDTSNKSGCFIIRPYTCYLGFLLQFKLCTPCMWPVCEITDQTGSFMLTLHSHPKEDEYQQSMTSSLNASPCMA
jgi:hypothetical protein